MITSVPTGSSFKLAQARPQAQGPKECFDSPGDSFAPGVEDSKAPGRLSKFARNTAAFLAANAAASLAAGCCMVAGALYVGTVLGPIIVGANKASIGPNNLDEAYVMAQTGAVGDVMMGSASLVGSIAKELTAPIRWGFAGGKEAFTSVYGYLRQG